MYFFLIICRCALSNTKPECSKLEEVTVKQKKLEVNANGDGGKSWNVVYRDAGKLHRTETMHFCRFEASRNAAHASNFESGQNF